MLPPLPQGANGTKRYRYYVCSSPQKLGWHTCTSNRLPLARSNGSWWTRSSASATSHAVLSETIAEVRAQSNVSVAELETERRVLERELGRWNAEVRKLAGDASTPAVSRLADLQERIRDAERWTTQINERIIAPGQEMVDEREIAPCPPCHALRGQKDA